MGRHAGKLLALDTIAMIATEVVPRVRQGL